MKQRNSVVSIHKHTHIHITQICHAEKIHLQERMYVNKPGVPCIPHCGILRRWSFVLTCASFESDRGLVYWKAPSLLKKQSVRLVLLQAIDINSIHTENILKGPLQWTHWPVCRQISISSVAFRLQRTSSHNFWEIKVVMDFWKHHCIYLFCVTI